MNENFHIQEMDSEMFHQFVHVRYKFPYNDFKRDDFVQDVSSPIDVSLNEIQIDLR